MNELRDLTPDMDTTLLVIKEAVFRGHEVLCTTPKAMWLNQGEAFGSFFTVGYDSARLIQNPIGIDNFDNFDMVLMRLDPPVDIGYINICQILSFVKAPVINDPLAIASLGEKTIPQIWPEMSPKTYLIRSYDELIKIIETENIDDIVLKPTDECGGRSVFKTNKSDYQLINYFNLCSQNESRHIIAQEYLDVIKYGDKRVFICGTEILGAMRRFPPQGDFRANIHLGANFVACEVTATEMNNINKISKYLTSRGIYWAAIDMIDEYVTEVNITSPSGIPEINKITGMKLELKLVDFIENFSYGQ